MSAEATLADMSVARPRAPYVSAPTATAVALPPGSRYGEGRRINLPAAILTILIHVGLLAAFLLVRDHVARKQEAKLTVVNLMPAAPPPAEQPEQPKIVPPVVVAPRPIVDIPTPSPIMVPTVPDPQPMPPTPPVATQSSAPPSPPAPPSVIQGGDLGSRMVTGKPPQYPTDSRRKREQGTVVLSLTLGYDGRVATISINQSSGFSRLDNAALDAVRKWRWEPIMRGGQAVMVKGLVEIPFVLKD
ncbi:MAG: energy transducer TonB [Sphingobium sp.]